MENQCCSSTFEFKEKSYLCSLELSMDLIGGKWKTMMIYHLREGTLRSGVLQRRLNGVTNKMFTQTARELEGSGLIERTVFPEVPPRVEYNLTEAGESILPIVLSLAEWGKTMSSK